MTLTGQDLAAQKHVEVSLRMIGHKVLLQANDSTSRVLPIENEKGQYVIRFESAFAFNPESLSETVKEIVKETKIAEEYIAELVQCETGKVVYSFEIRKQEDDNITPCLARDVPKSCYILVFTLFSDQASGNASAFSQTDKTGSGIIFYLIFFLSLAGFVLYVYYKRKNRNDPNLISLGKYHFDKKNTELILEKQRIELTSKEAELLMLLYRSVNNTVEREEILNKVWEDDGDYIGRTLDVFISKLRKKLIADPDVKIINVRGVGYKLVLNS